MIQLVKPAVRLGTVLAAAGVASAIYQRTADTADRRRFPPPGRLVDIGGRRLHLVSEGSGSPTVVIIPAVTDNVLGWMQVVHAATDDTGVCVYDRAGVGWSGPPPRGPVTTATMAEDLHALLTAASIPGPYVLAGHSMGGLVARRYHARYPGVAGMLLIDSSHEDQNNRDGWDGRRPLLTRAAQRQLRILGVHRLAASIGLIGGLDDTSLAREVSPEHIPAARAIELSSRQRRATVRELMALARPHGEPEDLGALPLTVLTSAPRMDPQSWDVWSQLQDELAALSTDSVHVRATKAGHYVHRDEPDLVIQAIRDLVKRCR